MARYLQKISSKLNFLKSKQEVKYLFVGAYNTFFGYINFLFIFHLFFTSENTIILLTLVHFLNVTHNYISYKFFVFKTNVNLLLSFIKFHMTYIIFYFMNLTLISLFYSHLKISIYISQMITIPIIVLMSFLSNKYFSFREKMKKK